MSIKILLADDSITIQKVVGIIFGGEEYSLTVVDNGKAAVEKARELNPDVLLIDALMPGMSGYEVCEAVRSTPAISSKPILLLTGSFEPFDENKAKTCGADDFLSKPFESQQIVTKVKELVEKGSSQAPAAEPEALAPPVAPAISVKEAAPAAAEEAPAADDIWGAFTAPEEPAAAPAAEAPAAEFSDVFATETEEPQLEAAAPETAAAPVEESTGSQWIPVEEETFEFEEETPAEPPAAAFTAPEPVVEKPVVEEAAFGETDFGSAATASAEPEIEFAPQVEPEPAAAAPAAPAAPTVAAVAAPAAAAALPAMSEDQLREALMSASRDVIERIVWEVVPDLAEVMIKEAIRKIKEGQ